MKKNKTLQGLFSFPGFKAKKRIQGIFGDKRARIILLNRQKKQLSALSAANSAKLITTASSVILVTLMRPIIGCMCDTNGDGFFVRGARACI
jgi:hypothetical protein